MMVSLPQVRVVGCIARLIGASRRGTAESAKVNLLVVLCVAGLGSCRCK